MWNQIPNSVKPWYLIINNNANRYTEKSNGNKYLTLVLTYESKEKQKKYNKIRRKVQGLIRSINNNLNNYDKKYIKTKFISDNDLPLKKTLNLENIELHKIIIVLDLFSMRIINTLQKS